MMTRKGFTLIELMILIVILGILAAIAVPKLVNGTNTQIYCKQFASEQDYNYCIDFIRDSRRDYNLKQTDIQSLTHEKIEFDEFIKMDCEMRDHCTGKGIIALYKKRKVESNPNPLTNAPLTSITKIESKSMLKRRWKKLSDKRVLFYNTNSDVFLADLEKYKKESKWSEYSTIKHMVNMNDGILVEFK